MRVRVKVVQMELPSWPHSAPTARRTALRRLTARPVAAALRAAAAAAAAEPEPVVLISARACEGGKVGVSGVPHAHEQLRRRAKQHEVRVERPAHLGEGEGDGRGGGEGEGAEQHERERPAHFID